jgi:serine/threonine protein kinase
MYAGVPIVPDVFGDAADIVPESFAMPKSRIMELLEGESLARRLERGPLPVDQVLDVARQIASVLDATHRQGVIHRDLKPDNIYLVHDDERASGERVKISYAWFLWNPLSKILTAPACLILLTMRASLKNRWTCSWFSEMSSLSSFTATGVCKSLCSAR